MEWELNTKEGVACACELAPIGPIKDHVCNSWCRPQEGRHVVRYIELGPTSASEAALDHIWALMYPGTRWAYPGQVGAHIQAYIEELKQQAGPVLELLESLLNQAGAPAEQKGVMCPLPERLAWLLQKYQGAQADLTTSHCHLLLLGEKAMVDWDDQAVGVVDRVIPPEHHGRYRDWLRQTLSRANEAPALRLEVARLKGELEREREEHANTRVLLSIEKGTTRG